MRIQARQCGSTLIVSLVFLLVFLVMALSIFRGSLTSSQAIGNMQWRNEAISAANEAIDQLLSLSNIATQPGNIASQVNTAPYQYDTDGDDSRFEISVNFPNVNGVTGPQCLRVEEVPADTLDPADPQASGCFASSSSGGIAVQAGVGGPTSPATGPSLCADSDWSMRVRAADPTTSTSVDVVQGYRVRVLTVAIPPGCQP